LANPPDIIFIAMERWDMVWRRNQHIAMGLADRHPANRILFVELPANPLRYSHWRNENIHFRFRAIPCRFHNLYTLTPPCFFPNHNEILLHMNEMIFRIVLRHHISKLKMNRPLLWVNPHYAAHLIDHVEYSALVYDVTDDWSSMSQPEYRKNRMLKQDAILASKADTIIVCSPRLYELKKIFHRPLFLIPNGVDYESYILASTKANTPSELTEMETPIFGYTGSLHPDRLDVELLVKLGKKLRKGSIVLVGPDMLPFTMRAALMNTPHIHFLPPVDYLAVPEITCAFDVCIVPHLVNDFTNSLHPLKLLEFMASGKPVVSTPVAGFRDQKELVRLADNPEDFYLQMIEALHEDESISMLRQQYASENTWENRLESIDNILGSITEQEGKQRCSNP
jgi:glycosyltransferase involved in cell wall biosynthesis